MSFYDKSHWSRCWRVFKNNSACQIRDDTHAAVEIFDGIYIRVGTYPFNSRSCEIVLALYAMVLSMSPNLS